MSKPKRPIPKQYEDDLGLEAEYAMKKSAELTMVGDEEAAKKLEWIAEGILMARKHHQGQPGAFTLLYVFENPHHPKQNG